ncbi:HNH endonuclease [Arthrobacter sp. zg-Y769]|uniref:HNH endonuclease n=1 Tax=Arthrobacter sp. zg-Y769 TaxID=2894191 RepID=UPI001E2AE893|nr:HNH endonuclease signature motif containing protein [Arthrobacter sp. zg-Y769]MCC9205049.1 HNH endonuclease [Arthrobacter sp. zg-Y769]
MDQLGNTERTTEEPGTEDHQPEAMAGEADAPRAACTLAVYRAELDAQPSVAADAKPGTEPADHSIPDEGPAPSGHAEAVQPGAPASTPDPDTGAADSDPDAGASASGADSSADGYPDGFTGTLALQNLESFDEQMVGEALSRMAHLMSWVQAQEARLVNRMKEIFRDDFHAASGRLEPGMAFSLAASECAAILNVPQVTAQRMMFEAGMLCGTHAATLAGLEDGRLSYQHAQVVLEQCENVPAEKLPGFEADLLKAAEGKTRAQFSAKARRLRERKFPDTISKRHLTAFEQRKVTLDREEDGMSCLSAYLRAEEAQQIYTTLSTAARGEQAAGDGRSTDQLRADILAQLLMGSSRSVFATAGSGRGDGPAPTGGGGKQDDRHGSASCPAQDSPDLEPGPDEGIVPRAEIMVLINAETLFGADDQPAELHGYGPISAEAARRLARNAAGWTGLAQDPRTGEILGVGRRRKVPAGLRRWLRARDGTCRFPGCRVNTANSDIDHTTDWAKGGPTDHRNLEHLCRRHHRFKTLGYWKARQPSPGIIEWTSPTGRVYRTEPFLELGSSHPVAEPPTDRREPEGVWADHAEEDANQEQVSPF